MDSSVNSSSKSTTEGEGGLLVPQELPAVWAGPRGCCSQADDCTAPLVPGASLAPSAVTHQRGAPCLCEGRLRLQTQGALLCAVLKTGPEVPEPVQL